MLVGTHSPQVASRGNLHWRSLKDQKDQAASTRVDALSYDEREDEVARMLAGAEVTAAAPELLRRSSLYIACCYWWHYETDLPDLSLRPDIASEYRSVRR